MSQVFTLVVPQWQGCGVGTGPFHGARAMRKMWGKDRNQAEVYVHEQSVPRKEENIWYGYEIIDHVQQVVNILDDHKPDRIVTLGGDCGSDLVPISFLNELYKGEVTVLWLGAHADLHTPESSLSHRFHGMSVRLLLGEGAPSLLELLPSTLEVEQFIYSGQHEVEHAERQFIVDNHMPIIPACHDCAEMLQTIIERTGRKKLYLHIDLNVIDPIDFDAVSYPAPGGFRFNNLLDLIRQLGEQFTIVGCGVIGDHPRGDEDAIKTKQLLKIVQEIMG